MRQRGNTGQTKALSKIRTSQILKTTTTKKGKYNTKVIILWQWRQVKIEECQRFIDDDDDKWMQKCQRSKMAARRAR